MGNLASTSSKRPFTIVIYGSCLAGYIASSTLARSLPDDYRIIHILPQANSVTSALYGGVTGPDGYAFFRSAGIEESDLFIKTNTSFSYGTHFQNWPSKRGNWVQCYSQPFVGLLDCPFDQVVNARGGHLQDYLISAQAALSSRFAHPPNDAQNALSRAEYGFHFSAEQIAKLTVSSACNERIERINATLADVRILNGAIETLILTDGQSIAGDLILDCSGTSRALMASIKNTFVVNRSLRASVQRSPSSTLGPPCRITNGSDDGWQTAVPLQGNIETLQISLASNRNKATEHNGSAEVFNFQTGVLQQAWHANCIGLGLAACTLEPLSPAPISLLHRSLQRLCELMPSGSDMSMERQEYNRQFDEDVANIAAFHGAHFLTHNHPKTPYWDEASALPHSDRLKRKIEQFDSRGLLVQFDHEPFNTEDWAILHYGMGRRPKRKDIRLQALQGADQYLEDLKQSIIALVPRIPPHDQYVARFRAYLEKKQHEHTTPQ